MVDFRRAAALGMAAARAGGSMVMQERVPATTTASPSPHLLSLDAPQGRRTILLFHRLPRRVCFVGLALERLVGWFDRAKQTGAHVVLEG